MFFKGHESSGKNISEEKDYLYGYTKENPFKIIVAGLNLDDGIGDFVHLYDFYMYLKAAIPGELKYPNTFLRHS